MPEALRAEGLDRFAAAAQDAVDRGEGPGLVALEQALASPLHGSLQAAAYAALP